MGSRRGHTTVIPPHAIRAQLRLRVWNSDKHYDVDALRCYDAANADRGWEVDRYQFFALQTTLVEEYIYAAAWIYESWTTYCYTCEPTTSSSAAKERDKVATFTS